MEIIDNSGKESNIEKPVLSETSKASEELESIPGAGWILFIAILSLQFYLYYGVVGIISGMLGLSFATVKKNEFIESPGKYSSGSYSVLKAGRIISIVGLVISSFYALIFILERIDLGFQI